MAVAETAAEKRFAEKIKKWLTSARALSIISLVSDAEPSDEAEYWGFA